LPGEFRVKANLAFVVRGPVLDLQLVLDEIHRFVAARPDLTLVYSTVSASKILIQEEGRE